MSNLPYFTFLLFMHSSRFFCTNFSFFVMGPCDEHFFLLFLTCCLSFNIWRSSFLRSSWLGCRIFFLSLELNSFLSVVSFFGLGSTVVIFFHFYLFFFCCFFKLSCLLSVVFFFSRNSAVVFLSFLFFLC